MVARLAKAMGALTIGIVTEPFTFEGFTRARQARKAIEDMRHAADTVVVVPNDRSMLALSSFCLLNIIVCLPMENMSWT